MSTRTKGFFEQDQRKPRPGQWSRRPHAQSNTNEILMHAAAPKPSIPATTQAKSKLKAFQFAEGEPTDVRSAGTEEAHDTTDVPQPSKDHDVHSNTLAPAESNPSRAPRLPHANTFPSTPCARLPLEDLIGNCDEPKKEEPANISPEEQIGWIPQSSADVFTPRQRKRKRAKSSSPSCPNSSSQQDQNAALTAELGVLSTAKRTPAADPAADLWRRYANGKQTGDSLNIPELNKLIFQDSPRPLETPMKNGSLRRWASTGNDWPTSKNKRRCTTKERSIHIWQDQTVVESAGKSKVASMVQRIQESLASQKLELERSIAKTVAADNPSSSSPLPETSTDRLPVHTAVSPLQNRHPNAKSPAKPTNGHYLYQEQKVRPPSQNMRATQSGGFRSDTAKPTADPLNPSATGHLHLQSKAPLPAYKRPSITRPLSQTKVQQVVEAAQPAVREVDEFGDDAFDLTADDLDELLSQQPQDRRLVDNTQHPNLPNQPQPNASRLATIFSTRETITLNDDDDEFGCDDIDEDSFVQAEFSATQAQRISPRKRHHRKHRSPRKIHSQVSIDNRASASTPQLQRYVVKQMVEGEYTNDQGRRCDEKVLLAENERGSETVAISLRGSWATTAVTMNSVVHVAHVPRCHDIAPLPTSPGQIMIFDDDSSPFLIVHPDHMLSATTVADSFDCIRKAVLQDRIKATGETSKAMIYGKILHEIFQQALSANQWDENFLAHLVERTVQAHVEGLWELGMRDTTLAAEEVRAKMGELAAWAGVFVAEHPSADSVVDGKQGEKVLMSISKLIAIEEHIWSPQFGLKGNVDATVQTTLVDDSNQQAKTLIIPFEVKTGRTTQSPAHRAQTALYTLLLSDRYDVAVEAGILYYLESSSMSRIAPPLVEVRQMVQQRNRLAAYIHSARHPLQPREDDDAVMRDVEERVSLSQEFEESGLPSLLKNPFKCGRCYAQGSCFTYHALVENGNADSAGLVDDQKKNHSLVWREAIGHLLSSDKNDAQKARLKRWFSKWDKLLTFEEKDQSRFRKELWTMSSKEREDVGRCFGRLVLKQDITSTAASVTTQAVDGIEGSGGKINRYAYVLVRENLAAGGSFAEGTQLTVGEPIVVSSEQGQWALANGYVVGVSKTEITVAVDRKLSDSRQRLGAFDGRANQAFRGTMTVGKEDDDIPAPDQPPVVYRLDKDEFSNGLALIRNNLVTMMSSHPIHTKLREQVIFGAEPKFNLNHSTPGQLKPTQLGEMNEDQQAAVTKVLSAEDYALILGMPGTGKTTTIAHIIRALLAQGRSILLTSFTHTAVDNILLKIRDIAPAGSILRLGVPAKINSQVQEFCQLAATPRTSIDEIETAYMETKIVATTCMGTNHALFHRRKFDICIVDEASQITLPTILGPLLHARRFVLVGDHFQLPPLVQNKAALEGGLDVSLFRQLSEEQPGAVAALGRQYRMCKEIMALSNELIYNGQLRCGNEAVAERTLTLSDPKALTQLHRPVTETGSGACLGDHSCWLAQISSSARKVVYANTDPIGKPAQETLTHGKTITNPVEAILSAQLVLSFLAQGCPASEIGVITLYRSQLALIRQLFKKAGIPPAVEVDSADRFQGRDKECIILSLVRSNPAGIVGDLLKDWRRVNVALTRARSKLVVLGSRGTLVNNELLARFGALVDREGWGLPLREGVQDLHGFWRSTQVERELVASTAMASPRAMRGSPGKNSCDSRSGSQKKKKSGQGSDGLPGTGSQQSPSKKRSPLRVSPFSSASSRAGSSNSSARNQGVSPSWKSKREVGMSPSKKSKLKSPVKRILGFAAGGRRRRKMQEMVAVEIWEDLTGEEF